MKGTHFLFVIALFLSNAISAQTERKVFWLHGYQGGEGTFDIPKEDVVTRFKVDTFSRSLNYSDNQSSLQAAANKAEYDILSGIGSDTNTEQNFIIAHSMGGLVARKMGMVNNITNGNKAYNGLITFGTPHQGAYPANTMVYNPGKITAAAVDACQSLSTGPIAKKTGQEGWEGRLLVAYGAMGKITNAACQAIDYTDGSGDYPLFSLFKTGIESELTTYAVSTLAPMPTDHNVVFYGVEDGKNDGSLTPRFIGALLHPHNDFPLYGADESDQMGIAFVNSQIDHYRSQWELYRKRRKRTYFQRKKYWGTLQNAYKKGLDWFKRLDPTWKDLIGVSSSKVVQQGCLCREVINTEYGPAIGPALVFSDATDCSDITMGNLSCFPVYIRIPITKESDAFILESSASNGPGMNYPPQIMPGSNHMQMKNDSQMGYAIDFIFKYGMGEGPSNYFYTEER